MEKLIIGNWKMHPTLTDSLVLTDHLKKQLEKIKGVKVVLAPPISWLVPVIERFRLKHENVEFAAQDVFYQNQGAFTSQVSAYLLKDLIKFAIIGHSERRRWSMETNEQVRMKIQSCLDWKITPIVCIGEVKRMIGTQNEIIDSYQMSKVGEQLMEALVGIDKNELEKIVFAHEPVWAIGTKLPASAIYTERVILRLRDKIAEKYSRTAAGDVKFLYGGSVDSNNAGEFLHNEQISGLLVGSSSVKVKEFITICQIASGFKD